MAIIPGVTGQKAELFDGAKIDSISEYTAGSGVSIQGRTNGTAIEAGKVGEVKTFTVTTVTITNANTWYGAPGALTTLTPGVWIFYIQVTGNTGTYLYAAQVGTSATGGVGPLLQSNVAVLPVTSGIGACASTPFAYAVTTNTPIYAHGYCSGNGSTGILVTGQAIRIA